MQRIAALQRDLLAWYTRARRDLPWRRTRDPYRIWLSETMLQQTRVETVIPYYERFLERFPDVCALADADEDDVLREWSGLGYYSRARSLHRAARVVAHELGGQLPSTAEGLRALPGVGPYTTGALLSIAFDRPAPLVDGNVRRVLARWLAVPELAPAQEWALAAELVPAERPGDFNQALMELGATVCTPRSPACAACPVRAHCAAAEQGPEQFPAPRRRAAQKRIEAVAGLVLRGSGPQQQLLLAQRPRRGLLGGMWELPCCAGTRAPELVLELERTAGLATRAREPLGQLEHGFTHRLLTLHVVRLELLEEHAAEPRDPALRWFTREQTAALAFSRLLRRALEVAGASSWAPPGPTRTSRTRSLGF